MLHGMQTYEEAGDADVGLRRLEERRKVKGQAYYERKKAARKQLADATASANIDEGSKKELESYGY